MSRTHLFFPTLRWWIAELKDWITNRWTWLDGNIPGTATNCAPLTRSEEEVMDQALDIFPNPSFGRFSVGSGHLNAGEVTIEILNATGNRVFSSKTHMTSGRIDIDISGLPKGIYFVCMTNGAKTLHEKVILE